jgi:hypothetical protein
MRETRIRFYPNQTFGLVLSFNETEKCLVEKGS